MRRPLLPLGTKAPWVLAGLGAVLGLLWLITGTREYLVIAVVAFLALIVAFPLAALLLGKEDDPDD